MLAPISWLKEYIDFKIPLKDLMWKLTEIGLTTESFQKKDGEVVLDIEVTPNRPDWLSILGIAREIAAINGKYVRAPKLNPLPKQRGDLKLEISNNFELCPRYSYIIIKDVKTKSSPEWLQKRLRQIGLRVIDNLVDITNYVMYEMGNPIHIFDYDRLNPKKLILTLSKGGEEFVSVDEKKYVLPKDAIIFKNGERTVDLCGIKGGANSGVTKDTKNILILVPIYNGVKVRKTAQSLALFSDASKIFERGANSSGTLDTLKRTVNLVLDLAGGVIASSLIDKSDKQYKPWKLSISLEKLEKVLGIKIPNKKIMEIFNGLNLSPKLIRDKRSLAGSAGKIICTIPTYRGDLKIEEDLIEEVARIYGYNKFPKTLPIGATTREKVPYYFDDYFHLKLKNILTKCGVNEVMTYSLVSRELINHSQLSISNHIKIANPISIDYEFMRTTIIPSLVSACKFNIDTNIKLFELGKVYEGEISKTKERYVLSVVFKSGGYREIKGVLEEILDNLNIYDFEIREQEGKSFWNPTNSAMIFMGKERLGNIGEIDPEGFQGLELDVATLEKYARSTIYKQLPKYPSQIEDITFILGERVKVGEIIKGLKNLNSLVSKIELIDVFNDAYTFRIWYQDQSKTLTDKEVESIRTRIIKEVKDKFGGTVNS